MTSHDSARPSRTRHRAGFWLIAAAFSVAMGFAGVPTPLYPLYAARDGFEPSVITIIFAAYAVGVMASLYLAGHTSDWLGRRNLVLASVLLEILAAGIFLSWSTVTGLVVARVVSGIGIGTLTATATAHLTELRAVSHPQENSRRATTTATIINPGGLALGPLVSGLLAQFSGAPLQAPFIVFLILLVLTGIGVMLVPETVDTARPHRPYRPQKITIPARSRRVFTAAAVSAAAAFSVIGTFSALTGSIVIGLLGIRAPAIIGLVVFAVVGASAASQVLLGNLSRRRQLQVAVSLMCAGLTGVTIVGAVPSLALFTVSGMVAGGGAGLVIRSSVAVAASSATPGNRSEVLAGMFLIGYIGLVVPVVALGTALAVYPIVPVLLAFAAATLVVVLSTSVQLLRVPGALGAEPAVEGVRPSPRPSPTRRSGTRPGK